MIKTLLAALIVTTTLMGGTATAQTGSGTLGKIKSANVINVAYSPDSLPFSFVGANKEPAGYSIDLCKRVIAQIARAVGDTNLKVNWIAGSVSERLQMVAKGRADLECANTTQTQSRLANVDFSNLIFIDGGGLLVKAGSPVNQRNDLAGKRVAVLKGTTTETRLNDVLRLLQISATVATSGARLAEKERAPAPLATGTRRARPGRLADAGEGFALGLRVFRPVAGRY